MENKHEVRAALVSVSQRSYSRSCLMCNIFMATEKLQHRVLLLKLTQKLTDCDLEELLFLCESVLSESTAESIKTATSLFRELEHRAYLAPNEYDFLKDCLLNIGRSDLAYMLPAKEEDDLVESLKELNVTDAKGSTSVFGKKKMLLHVSNQLRRQDLEKMAFLCSCEVQEGFCLIQGLERNGSISDENYTYLSDMLTEIGRSDLVRLFK